ncbi:DNA oxidative demethylase AlkB [Alcaligenes sp. WGS1538]|uniref:DNA oxidative demethylase AlkB n=1 Tax=Alcaligenes sp. WGS1538 TaxID=3366811 RepID=UPI00372D66C3
MSSLSLFESLPEPPLRLDAGLIALPGMAAARGRALRQEIEALTALSPWRHMRVPSGQLMSAAQTSCGRLGWITDDRGYRYTALDPLTGQAWPPMPELFQELVREACAHAALADFQPDTCLMNRYDAQARMSLHQDRNERDLTQPIVSVSLGREALFLWGGLRRADPVRTIRLRHGDVLIWWGPDRMKYHGVRRLAGPPHPDWGEFRVNLTFRRAA